MPFDLDAVIKHLDHIKPKGVGVCLQVTAETVKTLIGGPSHKIKDDVMTERLPSEELLFEEMADELNIKPFYVEDEKRNREENKFKDGDACYRYMMEKIEPMQVAILSTEGADHFVTIVKSDDKRLYLLDTDGSIYQEIKERKDFSFALTDPNLDLNKKAILEKLKKMKMESYDYLAFDGDEDLQVYRFGNLHVGWNKQVEKEAEKKVEKEAEKKVEVEKKVENQQSDVAPSYTPTSRK